MPRKVLLLTYSPQTGEDLAAYDDWIRAYDYPAFRQNPRVQEYHCYRIVQPVQGEERFTYFDLIFHDSDDFARDVRGDPVVAAHAKRYHETWFERPGPHNVTMSLAEEIWG